MIIDFHAHLQRDLKTREYQIEEQLEDMRRNHIDYRVISTFDGLSMKAASDFILDLHRQDARFIPCAAINPKLDDALSETRRMLDTGEVRMIEMDSLECGFQPELLEPVIIPILEECARHQALVKLFSGSTHRGAPDQWRKYFLCFPKLCFVILHMGAGDFQYGTIDLCHEFPNLILETSMACEAPALKRALRELGLRRFVFGTSFPDYFSELEIMKFQEYGLSEVQKEAIYAGNARCLLKLDEVLSSARGKTV